MTTAEDERRTRSGHRATLHYTEALVTRAVGVYWRRAVGIGGVLAAAAAIAMLCWLLARGDRSWLVGLMGTAVLLGLVMPIAVYVVHYRNSMRRFRAMGQPTGELVADDAGITISSDVGSSTVRWELVKEVWCSDTVWLLLFSRAQFATLPLADLSAELRAYVLDRVRAAGGKVSG